jgi:hypothetical protein
MAEPTIARAVRRGLGRYYLPILLAIPTLALALSGPGSRVPEAAVALVGIGASTYLRTVRESWAVDLWALPALVAAGVVALSAGATLPAELLAGATALAALYWIASDAPGLRVEAQPAYGLLLPGLSVGLAVSVTLFLPAGPALVGVASVILVALFFGLAAVLGAWSDEEGPG